MMKFANLAALASIAALADAGGKFTTLPKFHKGNRSAFAQKRVGEIKDRMELTYGKGLVGLRNPLTGEIDPKRFGKDRKVGQSAGEWLNIQGMTINSITFEAFSYGYVEGVQFKGISASGLSIGDIQQTSQTMSNCFYAMKGIIDSVEVLLYDWKYIKQFSGEIKWFNVFVYDPIHILGDTTVLYEMCNVYEDLDKLTGLFSMDWGLLGSMVTSITINLAYEARDMLIDITNNMGRSCQEEAALAAQNAVNEGLLNNAEDYLNSNGEDTSFDVDALTEALEQAGSDLLNCVVTDVNLYKVGRDCGDIIAHSLQAYLDPTN